MCSNCRSMPKRLDAACSTRMPSGITSWPMPSPAMAAILNVLLMGFLGESSSIGGGRFRGRIGAEAERGREPAGALGEQRDVDADGDERGAEVEEFSRK